MKTTTTETKKPKTKAPTEEQIADAKAYESELESKINSRVRDALIAAATGRPHYFGASGIDSDKRSAPKKIRDLVARGLIMELPKNEWGDIPYFVTDKAIAASAPPLTDAELESELLRQYEKQVADMRRTNRSFRDFWKSAPAVSLTDLPRQALHTIIMRPQSVVAARCQMEEYQPAVFIPYEVGSEFTETPRANTYGRNWLNMTDSILVSCPAVCARWRVVLAEAIRRHCETSPEAIPAILGVMLGESTKRAEKMLYEANCHLGFGYGDSKPLDKKLPSEWEDVMREHIAHAEKKIASYQKSMNAAAMLLDRLESIDEIDKAFADAVDYVVAENVDSIP
jgi:hypothetical protein